MSIRKKSSCCLFRRLIMELSYKGLKNAEAWEKAGIQLPAYDPRSIAEATAAAPVWVHFGIGNIFRIFIGGIADKLISEGDLGSGITCVETFDYDVADKIYEPFDNLALCVTLHADGRAEKKVIGSLGEAIAARMEDEKVRDRLKAIFSDPGLQFCSYTVTEKGYALRNADGEYLSYVVSDIENGPEHATGAMGITASLMYERFLAGGYPLALVSMDNVSRNGEKLNASVTEIAREWAARGLVENGFLEYIEDGSKVSFPWTMIDKITPRPSEASEAMLKECGVDDMDILVTSKKTYIAPFVNAEAPGYLVVEDDFPNGRPALEKAGVYMTDRETVNKSERMKVTAALNPVHTAVCTFARLLGYELFADAINDPDLHELAVTVSWREGLPVAVDPGIISPEKFLDELMTERFPNKYLGDTNARIAVDISQMVGIRFGETIKAYTERDGDASALIGIPLAIAGWIRYLIGIDDQGGSFDLSPDPMLPELGKIVEGIRFDAPDSAENKLRPLLSNVNIFGSDLYSAGIGDTIEIMVREMLEGRGAVRNTLRKYLRENREEQ